MAAIKFIGLILLSFIVGVFAISNILLPLFYTLPRIRKEKQKGGLIKSIPIPFIIWAPVLWTGILITGLYFAHRFIPDNIKPIFIGLGAAFLMVLNRLFNKSKDLDADFNNTYKDYLYK